MSTIVNIGLVGVSTHTIVVSSGQVRSRLARSVRSATDHPMPAGPSTRVTSRKVPPYASSGRITRSPGASVRSTASSAAIPLANAKPYRARSREATHSSSARRVGLPLRAYSNSPCRPTASCANVLASVTGVTTAPLTGSGS